MEQNHQEPAERVGLVIEGARKLLAFTQKDVAGRLGIAQSTMSRSEKGFLVPDTLLMSQFMDMLHIDTVLLHEMNLGKRDPFEVLFDCYKKNPSMWSEQYKRIFCSPGRVGKKIGEPLWEMRKEFIAKEEEVKAMRRAKRLDKKEVSQ